MPAKNKLKEIERERGKPLDRIIPPLVDQYGQEETARQLGVSQPTISEWLKDNQYVPITLWVKAATAKDKADIAAAVARHEAWELHQEQGEPS